jgi:hypothetical protein
MSDPIQSRTERRQRRQRRRAGLMGLGVLLLSIAATLALLLVGPASARGAVSHHPRSATSHVVDASSSGAR